MPSTRARVGRVDAPPPQGPPLGHLVLAFACVYLIWGSTYLAIRFAIESLPPLLMAAARFLIAGSLLYGWARIRGRARPGRAQWKAAAIVGGLLLVGGNGAVVVSEQWIPSGLAALVVATVPLWLVVLDMLWGSRARPGPRVWVGLIGGLGGVVMLFGAPGAGAGGPQEFFGVLLLLGGAMSWAGGSIVARMTTAPPGPFLWVGMQMLAGGAMLLVLGVVLGELGDFEPAAVTLRSILALVYLIVFGAVIGYSAYIWLLRVTTAARAGTYAYVNPVVAMALGWLFADEPLTLRSALAAAVILASVIVISTDSGVGGVRGLAKHA